MSIDIENLSVNIGKKRIVTDVSIHVPDAKLVGLLGPNGSGKSTVLKTLYRVQKPVFGRILIDGDDLLAMPTKLAAKRLAVVAQDAVLEFDATVTEIVMIGRTPHKRGLEKDNEHDRDIVADSLARVGCAQLADRSIHALSGGERQRVFIARALAQGCDHLVLDEPTNHLDIHYQIEVLEIVSGLGVSVLAALHDLSLAGLYCDSVYLLAGGTLIAHGLPEEVITPATVRETYGADVHVIPHPETSTPYVIARRSVTDSSNITTEQKGVTP